MSFLQSIVAGLATTFSISILAQPCVTLAGSEPSEYILSFDTSDNPLNIKIETPYSKNYFILIGDWGAPVDSGYINVQKGVASKMQSFYESQKANGKNLLFVGAVGDNFYYTGQPCDTFTTQWSDIYGDELTSVPWLAIFGNHDWGNDDSHAMCAFNDPKYTDESTGISYNSNALIKSKLGCAPDNFYMPDFGYYYTINELSFELLGLEQSYYDCPGGIGGDSSGSSTTFSNCGSDDIGCDMLHKMATASEDMLADRAKGSNNTNFMIINHYPSRGGTVLSDFINNRNDGGLNDIILSAYGHTHEQKCDEYSSKNESRCAMIMTGGGGGCCSESTLRGFFPVGFNDKKEMVQEFKIDDSAISCYYPCTDSNTFNKNVNQTQLEFETCCHTIDDLSIDCTKYDLTKC